MDTPPTSGTSWIERMSGALRRWLRRRQPVAPKQFLNLSPPCSECGARTATVFLAEYGDGWHLSFQGIAGGNPPGGDPLSGERAQAIRDALSPPYEPAKIQAAGFYDDFGYCVPCEKFYCATHWQASTSGSGKCPAGHFKSLDPHWHPDWDDL